MKRHGDPTADTVVAPRSEFRDGLYGRMFRNLPPFEPPVAKPAGSEAGDDEAQRTFFAQLANKMHEPAIAQAQYDGQIPAGYSYLGQFITHDITFDPVSSLQRRNDPNMLRNFRTPRFDLDSIYARGPADTPFLYDSRQRNKFLFSSGVGAREQDVQRNPEGIAIIGDPRNDSNLIISQLHVAFLRFHNAVVYSLEDSTNLRGEALFSEAQRLVQWHYQWIVVHDYLKRHIIDDPSYVDYLIDQAKQRRRFTGFANYSWKNLPFIPFEFSVAAFRFGHSMIRSEYDINHVQKGIPLVDMSQRWGQPAGNNLVGFRKLPERFTVQWDRFFKFPNSPDPQPSRRIDTLLSRALAQLPPSMAAANRSVAYLDLVRGWKLGLPSGQSVARAVGIPKSDILEGDDPLWCYVLLEAMEKQRGMRLGRLGSILVGEVLLGLLGGDPQSYLKIEPNWTPTLPGAVSGDFTMSDLLTYAEVPITQPDVELVIGETDDSSGRAAERQRPTRRWPG